MKVYLEVSLVSLTLRASTVLNIFETMLAISLYWFAAQQQTSTLTTQKCGFFYAKFSAELNKISLFFLKATGRGRKMAKTKVVHTRSFTYIISSGYC